MKYIFLNLKRFDVPVEYGGVNRLAAPADWGKAIVEGTQAGLAHYDPAEVEFVMNVKLTGAAPTEAEMQKPAEIKPAEAAPRPAAPTKPKKEPAAKPVPRPKKAKEDKPKQDDGIMQLSLWG